MIRSLAWWLMWGWFALADVAVAGSPCVAKTVSLLVPYPAGSLSDAIARQIGHALSGELGQQVLVENVAGAGGVLAARKALARAADGHTLFLGSPNEVILAPLTQPHASVQPQRFLLLSPISYHPLVLIARAGLKTPTLDAFLARGRDAGSSPLTYGSVGIGTLYHLAGEDLAARARAAMVHIPYKGGGPLMQDLLGGRLDFAILPWSNGLHEHARAGRLHILGVAATEPDRHLPDMPALGSGQALSGFDYSIWSGLLVRKETPGGSLACLHRALSNVLHRTQVQSGLMAMGARPAEPLSLSASARLFAEQSRRFQDMARQIQPGLR